MFAKCKKPYFTYTCRHTFLAAVLTTVSNKYLKICKAVAHLFLNVIFLKKLKMYSKINNLFKLFRNVWPFFIISSKNNHLATLPLQRHFCIAIPWNLLRSSNETDVESLSARHLSTDPCHNSVPRTVLILLYFHYWALVIQCAEIRQVAHPPVYVQLKYLGVSVAQIGNFIIMGKLYFENKKYITLSFVKQKSTSIIAGSWFQK